MFILSLNDLDLAGLSYNLMKAIRTYTDNVTVSVSNSGKTYIDYPIDMDCREFHIELVKPWIEKADVIHLNEYIGLDQTYGVLPEKVKNAKIVLHLHGEYARGSRNVADYYRQLFGADNVRVITSTPDLLEQYPEAKWFPSCVPFNEYRKTYPPIHNNPPIVFMSPTVTGVSFIEMIEKICREAKLPFQILQQKTHNECLAAKSKADIYFDRIVHFYGVNSIEAAGFGMPVICGMTPFAEKYVIENQVDCPFTVVHNEEEVNQAVKKLAEDPLYLESMREKCYQYVMRMHHPEVATRRFLELVTKWET